MLQALGNGYFLARHFSFFLFQRQPAFLHFFLLGTYLHVVSATSPEHASPPLVEHVFFL